MLTCSTNVLDNKYDLCSCVCNYTYKGFINLHVLLSYQCLNCSLHLCCKPWWFPATHLCLWSVNTSASLICLCHVYLRQTPQCSSLIVHPNRHSNCFMMLQLASYPLTRKHSHAIIFLPFKKRKGLVDSWCNGDVTWTWFQHTWSWFGLPRYAPLTAHAQYTVSIF